MQVQVLSRVPSFQKSAGFFWWNGRATALVLEASAVRSAIDSVAAAGGGLVYLEPGIFNVSTTINLRSGVSLMGSGFGTVIAAQMGPGQIVFNIGNVDKIRFGDFAFNGNQALQSNFLKIDNLTNSQIQNIASSGLNNGTFILVQASTGPTQNNCFRNLVAEASRYGFSVGGVSPAFSFNTNEMNGIRLTQVAEYGIVDSDNSFRNFWKDAFVQPVLNGVQSYLIKGSASDELFLNPVTAGDNQVTNTTGLTTISGLKLADYFAAYSNGLDPKLTKGMLFQNTSQHVLLAVESTSQDYADRVLGSNAYKILSLLTGNSQNGALLDGLNLEAWLAPYFLGKVRAKGISQPPTDNVTAYSPTPSINGTVDGVFGASINGWACAQGDPYFIPVDLYLGGPLGIGILVGRFNANLPSEAAAADACQSNGTAYRYSISLSAAQLNQFAGRSIYVYGISPVGLGNDPLQNSGRFTVP